MSGPGSTQVPPPAADEVAPPLNMMPIVQENRLPTLAFYSWCQQMWASLQGTAGIIPSIKFLLEKIAIIFGMHGDGTLSSDGTLTVTGTQGQPFGYFATGTDASHLTGTVPPSVLPIATTTSLGGVIPDGTTITVDPDGTIHSSGGGGSGTVLEVDSGVGLTGGPITTTGTLSLATVADQRILSNISGGVAAPIPNTLSDLIDDIFGNTRGDVLYRGVSTWAALPPGATANLPLVTGGPGADPAWATNVNVPGWLNVGATGAPANTTAGDINGNRLALNGLAFSASNGLYAALSGSLTATAAGNSTGFGAINTLAPAANSAAQFRVFSLSNQFNAAGINFTAADFIVGGYFENRVFNAGTIGTGVIEAIQANGLILASSAASCGNVSNVQAVHATPFTSFGNALTPTITKAAAFEAQNSTVGTATLVGQAGFVSEGMTSATNNTNFLSGTATIPTGNWGFYQADANNNSFKGPTVIGSNTAPGTSLVLDVNSTTGAFAPPRMTTTQRLALTASNGMIVYDNTLAQFYKYESGVWGPFTTIITSLVYEDGTVPAGNTVANTTVETTITSTYSFPASSLQVGNVIRVGLSGLYSTTLTPNLTLKIKLGGVTLVSTGAIVTTASLANAGWDAEATFIVTATGASGKLECQGIGQFGTGATTGIIVPMTNTAPVTINTTNTNALTVTLQWGTASTSDTITCREMTVWVDTVGAAASGNKQWSANSPTAVTTTSHALKGFPFTPYVNMTIYRVFSMITVAASAQYTYHIVTLDASFKILSIVASSATVTPASTGDQGVIFTFASPVALAAGVRYGVLVAYTNGSSGTAIMPLWRGTATTGLLATDFNTFIFYDAVAPAVNLTVTSSGSTPYHISLEWSL